MTQTPQPPPISETDLASELGIPREVLRACRKNGIVKETADWTNDNADGGRVIYTHEGVAKIRQHLALPPSEKKEGPPALVTCRVQSHPTNPALMMCVPVDSTKPVRVRIKAALRRSHAPGSMITARPLGDPSAGLLEFVPTPKGARLLSQPGKAEPTAPGTLA